MARKSTATDEIRLSARLNLSKEAQHVFNQQENKSKFTQECIEHFVKNGARHAFEGGQLQQLQADVAELKLMLTQLIEQGPVVVREVVSGLQHQHNDENPNNEQVLSAEDEESIQATLAGFLNFD